MYERYRFNPCPAGRMKVDPELVSEVLLDALARGETVRVRVQGVSMLPWLREGDQVCIRPSAGRLPRRGDVVLFRRAPGRLILHRIVGVCTEAGAVVCDCLGDSESGSPERVPAANVIGVVAITPVRRAVYRMLHRPRRWLNRLLSSWGLRLRHD